jgi:hypothetical protein
LRQPLNPVFLYHQDHDKLPLRGVLELRNLHAHGNGKSQETAEGVLFEQFE